MSLGKTRRIFFRILTRVWIRTGRKELPRSRQQLLEREFLRLWGDRSYLDTHTCPATQQLAGWT